MLNLNRPTEEKLYNNSQKNLEEYTKLYKNRILLTWVITLHTLGSQHTRAIAERPWL